MIVLCPLFLCNSGIIWPDICIRSQCFLYWRHQAERERERDRENERETFLYLSLSLFSVFPSGRTEYQSAALGARQKYPLKAPNCERTNEPTKGANNANQGIPERREDYGGLGRSACNGLSWVSGWVGKCAPSLGTAPCWIKEKVRVRQPLVCSEAGVSKETGPRQNGDSGGGSPFNNFPNGRMSRLLFLIQLAALSHLGTCFPSPSFFASE